MRIFELWSIAEPLEESNWHLASEWHTAPLQHPACFFCASRSWFAAASMGSWISWVLQCLSPCNALWHTLNHFDICETLEDKLHQTLTPSSWWQMLFLAFHFPLLFQTVGASVLEAQSHLVELNRRLQSPASCKALDVDHHHGPNKHVKASARHLQGICKASARHLSSKHHEEYPHKQGKASQNLSFQSSTDFPDSPC